MKKFRLFSSMLILGAIFGVALRAMADTNEVVPIIQRAVAVDALDVAPVWAGHPVGFALLTHPPFQFVAYYDDQRQLTVAERGLDERHWTYNRLPDTTGWDSHNFIALTADDDGYLHLSGDMHVIPLKYFRSAKPWEAATFQRIKSMIGTNEQSATYPQFIHGPNHELIFTYRDGGSGRGNQIYNVYHLKSQTWHRLFQGPLTDGQGHRNAYYDGPVKGPDGWYHLDWVWRESPNAASNHDLCYARSRDLIHWETSTGRPLKLPITLASSEIIDPVPAGGGIINGNTKIGFDDQNRVTISYQKNDAAGNTQPWIARLENGQWHRYQTANWPWHWDFSGGGSLPFGIHLGAVHHDAGGWLTQNYNHIKFGAGTWLLDPQTLRAIGHVQRQETPPEFAAVTGTFPGLQVRWQNDSGTSGAPGLTYKLRWETLDANRDAPRTGPLPPPSVLRVIAVQTTP